MGRITFERDADNVLSLQGEAAVGKSSVVLRFVSNEFQENKEPTIGAAFLTVSLSTSRKERILISILQRSAKMQTRLCCHQI